jgi:hypothetical protein
VKHILKVTGQSAFAVCCSSYKRFARRKLTGFTEDTCIKTIAAKEISSLFNSYSISLSSHLRVTKVCFFCLKWKFMTLYYNLYYLDMP